MQVVISKAAMEEHVDALCADIDRTRDRFESERSWETVRASLVRLLQCRETFATEWIVLLGEAGFWPAHRALLDYTGDMDNQRRSGELLERVAGYKVKALLSGDFRPLPRGRHMIQHLLRDAFIPLLVDAAALRAGVPPTRNRASRIHETPSGALLVHLALKKRGIKLSETRVNRLYWARWGLAQRLVEALPPLPEKYLMGDETA
jgi:hypothetical protein